MKEKMITPNYERMRESFCYAVQYTWLEYCKATSNYLKSIWFNERGELVMNGTDELKKKLDEATAAHDKALRDLKDFDEWVKMQKQSDIFMNKLLGGIIMSNIELLLKRLEENLDGQGSENIEEVSLYEYLKQKYDNDCECEMGG